MLQKRTLPHHIFKNNVGFSAILKPMNNAKDFYNHKGLINGKRSK